MSAPLWYPSGWFTDALVSLYARGCYIRQPRIEPGFPDGCSVPGAVPETVLNDLANPPEPIVAPT